jgi:hypothetical protein
MLGFEDHGIFTFFLMLDGEGWGCGFGGMFSDSPGLGKAIGEILNTLEVDKWEQLSGLYVRAKVGGPGRGVEAIGQLLKDKWVTAAQLSEILGVTK